MLVTRPDVTVVKKRHAGQDTEIQVGETVDLDLVVTNSGDTTLATVPMSDSFDAARSHLHDRHRRTDTHRCRQPRLDQRRSARAR